MKKTIIIVITGVLLFFVVILYYLFRDAQKLQSNTQQQTEQTENVAPTLFQRNTGSNTTAQEQQEVPALEEAFQAGSMVVYTPADWTAEQKKQGQQVQVLLRSPETFKPSTSMLIQATPQSSFKQLMLPKSYVKSEVVFGNGTAEVWSGSTMYSHPSGKVYKIQQTMYILRANSMVYTFDGKYFSESKMETVDSLFNDIVKNTKLQ